MTTNGRALLLATLTEKQWQQQVVEWATRAGWRTYHTADSRRSTGGFPDLVFVKPGHPVLFAELKKVGGRVSPQQRIWLDELGQARKEVFTFLWRPTDEAEVKHVLGLKRNAVENAALFDKIFGSEEDRDTAGDVKRVERV